MALRCPKCNSANVETLDAELGLVHCRDCDYDDLEEDVVPRQRRTQREKARFSPYQQGGAHRTRHQ